VEESEGFSCATGIRGRQEDLRAYNPSMFVVPPVEMGSPAPEMAKPLLRGLCKKGAPIFVGVCVERLLGQHSLEVQRSAPRRVKHHIRGSSRAGSRQRASSRGIEGRCF
jgi:hypothetical protein